MVVMMEEGLAASRKLGTEGAIPVLSPKLDDTRSCTPSRSCKPTISARCLQPFDCTTCISGWTVRDASVPQPPGPLWLLSVVGVSMPHTEGRRAAPPRRPPRPSPAGQNTICGAGHRCFSDVIVASCTRLGSSTESTAAHRVQSAVLFGAPRIAPSAHIPRRSELRMPNTVTCCPVGR